MGLLEGKVALVTGGGDGLGLGISRVLSRESAAIVAMGRRLEKVAAIADEIKSKGGRALAVKGDVSVRADVDAAVDAAIKEFGTIDILVNNAVGYDIASLEDLTEEQIDKVVKSGIYGAIYMMQACFPHLKTKGGKIINFGSTAGTEGLVGHAHYSSVKQGILGLTRNAALEWGKYGIRVNAIMPLADSPLWRTFRDTGDQKAVKKFLDTISLGYMGGPEDIGNVVLFFASHLSDWVTGRALFADGGQGGFR